jgi:putative transposase
MISFKGKHFSKDIILMSVRWYCSYALSYREIEELMLERGVKIDHATLNRWVEEYAPLLLKEFKKKKKVVGKNWKMDETYLKVKGKWYYQYRAVDEKGRTIDFLLSEKLNKKAANQFFKKSIKSCGIPIKINLDKNPANISGLEEINRSLKANERIIIKRVKYLNNMIEQDHRFIEKITQPMKGFKSFYSASATLKGIELSHMLRKGQLKHSSNKPVFEQFYKLAA